jgi:hypothetical protein
MLNIGIGLRISGRRGGTTESLAVVVSASVEQATPAIISITHDKTVTGVVAGDYTLTGKTISDCTINDTIVVLTVTVAYGYGDAITVDYTKNGGNVESYTAQSVTNNITHPLILEDGNTVGWYIASDLSTITKDGSDLVSVWGDKLGNNNLSQSTDARKPTWTANGISFISTSHLIKAFALIQPYIIYAVQKVTSWNSGYYLFNGGNQDIGVYQATSTPKIYIDAGAGCDYNANLNFTLNQKAILRCMIKGANSFIQMDSSAAVTGNSGSGNPGGFSIGRRYDYIGNGADRIVNEVIVRKSADSTPNQTIIYNYLKAKNGL